MISRIYSNTAHNRLKTIQVTCGSGYICSHACVVLLEVGYEAIVVNNFSNIKFIPLERVQEITGKPLSLINSNLLNTQAS